MPVPKLLDSISFAAKKGHSALATMAVMHLRSPVPAPIGRYRTSSPSSSGHFFKRRVSHTAENSSKRQSGTELVAKRH
eukprot:2017928-Ditylum_brightwellii.AAC.1